MPGLEQKEYLELFDKIFKDHSFNGEDICKYDRFIYDVVSCIDGNLGEVITKELEIYEDSEDYHYYFDSFYTVLFQSEMAIVEPILKDYIKNKIFSVGNGYLSFDGVED
ncbi:hypothetical protein [Klebsiella pneumoniae]|uniref:hypothetical protein n=1 Tax=Klebsiella pneumoniae TaxID=573 RepID=UPI0013310204|nr:hypothetical protein [Klebsiella pneumoniae]